MIKVTSLEALQMEVEVNKDFQEVEKERLLTQARQYFKPGDTIYIFFTLAEINSSKFDQSTKEGLCEILQRPGEIAAVYHEPDLREAWRMVKLHC